MRIITQITSSAESEKKTKCKKNLILNRNWYVPGNEKDVLMTRYHTRPTVWKIRTVKRKNKKRIKVCKLKCLRTEGAGGWSDHSWKERKCGNKHKLLGNECKWCGFVLCNIQCYRTDLVTVTVHILVKTVWEPKSLNETYWTRLNLSVEHVTIKSWCVNVRVWSKAGFGRSCR